METYFSPTALELRKRKGMGALLLEKMRDVLLHILRYLGGIGRYESVQMFNDVSRLYNDISDVLADYAANREAEEVAETAQPGKSAWMVTDELHGPAYDALSEQGRAEFDEVVSRYQNTPQWLKAPNGKDTNLTPFQWVEVRTPSFKKWFGDWEAEAEIKAMYDRIIEWGNDVAAINWAKGKTLEECIDHFGNELKAIAYLPSGYMANFNGTALDNRVYSGKAYFIDHIANHNHNDIGLKEFLDLQSMFLSPDEVIKDNRTKPNGKAKDALIFVKRFTKNRIAIVELSEEEGFIVLHKSLYNTKDRVYPGLPRVSGGGRSPISHANSQAPGGSLSARDTNNTVTHYLEKSNSDDVSKILDENGEPLVVYHGSRWNPLAAPEGKGVFSHGKVKNTSEGVGFYFTGDKSLASGYGDTGAYFLNLRNPVYAYGKLDLLSEDEMYDIEERDDLDGDEIEDALRDARDEKVKAKMRNVIDAMRGKGYEFYDEIEQDFISTLDGNSTVESVLDSAREAIGFVVDEDVDEEKFMSDYRKAEMDEFGIDGYVSKNYADGKGTYVAFDSNQIKSATDNNGDYSRQKDDVRWMVSEREKQLLTRSKNKLKNIYKLAINTKKNTNVFKNRKSLYLSPVPLILQWLGIPDGSIKTKVFILRKLFNDHEIDSETFSKIPLGYANPVIVFKDENGIDYDVITDLEAKDLEKRNGPIMVYFRFSEKGFYFASAYSRTEAGEEKYIRAIKEKRILYYDKERALNLPFKDKAKSLIKTLNVEGSQIKTPEDFKKYLESINKTNLPLQSDFSSQGDAKNVPDFSSQGGKNLITRDHVDDAFGTIGREARATKAVYANHNDILDTLKGTDADNAWKQLAPSLLAFAGDLKGLDLSTPAIDAAIETLGGIDNLPEAFDRFMRDGTARDDATRDALSALKMLLLSVWQGNGQTMEVDDDVRTELDARLAAGECVGNMLPLADVRAALKALEGTGVPGNGLPYDTLHLLQRVETQIRDRQEQHLKRTLNTLPNPQKQKPRRNRWQQQNPHLPPGKFFRKQSDSSPIAVASLIAERRDNGFLPVSYALIVVCDIPASVASCFCVKLCFCR